MALWVGLGRLPSSECSLPRSRLSLSRLARGITRSPPPVSLLACFRLSPLRSGFRRCFTCCARLPLGLRASELDPWSFDRWTERRSSTSATTAIHEHHRVDRPTPVSCRGDRNRRALSRVADADLRLPNAGGIARRVHGTEVPYDRSDDCRSRFHGSGAGRLSPTRALRFRSFERAETALTPTRSARTPLVMRSSQRRLKAPSLRLRASRESTLRGAPGRERHRSAISPHEPVSRRARGHGRLACAERPPAEGRVLSISAKRSRVRRTRGAFHR